MSRHGECGDVVYHHAFHQAERLLTTFEDAAEDETAWGGSRCPARPDGDPRVERFCRECHMAGSADASKAYVD